jgi:hypothetical protein
LLLRNEWSADRIEVVVIMFALPQNQTPSMIMERNFNAHQLRSCRSLNGRTQADLVIGDWHPDELSATWLTFYKD